MLVFPANILYGVESQTLLLTSIKRKHCWLHVSEPDDNLNFFSVNGKTIDMTEDHRVASATERARIARTGQPLRDGEARLSGMDIVLRFR